MTEDSGTYRQYRLPAALPVGDPSNRGIGGGDAGEHRGWRTIEIRGDRGPGCARRCRTA